MMKRILLMVVLFLGVGVLAFAQGTIKGTITDKETGEVISFANVAAFQNGKLIAGGVSDMKGIYTIKPLPPGKYDLRATFVGYHEFQAEGFTVNATGFSVRDIQMSSTATTLKVVDIVEEKDPLITKGPESGKTLGAEEISRMPFLNVDGIVNTVAGVSFGSGSARGEGNMVTMLNGVRRHTGSNNFPIDAIQEVQVILGGTPASIGEAIGGARNITLKPPSHLTMGRLQYETRLDYTGSHRLDMFLTGPLWIRKDSNGTENTLMGYRLSAFVATVADGNYRKDKYWMLKEDVMNDLIKTPLVYNPLANSIEYRTEHLRTSDFEQVKARDGMRVWNAFVEGGLTIRFDENATLAINGEYNYQNGLNNAGFPLTNTAHARSIVNAFALSADFTHRLKTDTSSIFQNLMYNITVSYNSNRSLSYNDDLREDLFKYGYVGKFTPHYSNPGTEQEGEDFELVRKDLHGQEIYAYEQLRGLPKVDSITFIPNVDNPLSNYTSQLYSIAGSGFNDINYIGSSAYKGVINGGSPSSPYGLFTNVGVPYTSYSKSQSDFWFVQAKASADIKGHNIEFGFQYDQTTLRSYSLSAGSLWTVMRENVNRQIFEHEADPIIDESGQDVYFRYNRIYNESAQTNFDRRLREKLGYKVDGFDWLAVDSYDPDIFSVDMLSADEMFRGGNTIVSYLGYDHTGNIVRGRTNIDDFFNNTDRILGAWSPIYMSGYIQDQFYFSDLIFNVGLRVDRFDGNQMVLKDPYLLYGGKQVKDVRAEHPELSHPDNIGDDYVVYVSSLVKEQKEITGYRKGSNWYDANGTQISDPYQIKGDNPAPTPWRPDGLDAKVSSESFKDYEPQIVVQPRIAFSFPVSDQSQFKASYDIIARRPSVGWQAPYFDYMFMSKVGSNPINNPDLKPEKITNYELGFQQALNDISAIYLSAYYKETRDLISIIQLVGADPNPNLFSYGNIAYRSTKGLSVVYDLRRSKNVRMSANYTLQYAEGTMLPQATLQALMIEGYPNLKLLNPIGDDRRHEVKLDFDFRYGNGKEYNGPVSTRKVVEDGVEKSKSTRWLENAGAHITGVFMSGAPYTKLESWTQKTIVGAYNSARLPSNFYLILQLDKAWLFKSAIAGKRPSALMAYARINNLLNLQNIIGVYPITGDPEDDGYLTDPGKKNEIANQLDEQSYRDLYQIALRNSSMGNYAGPRTITLGLSYSF